MKTHGIKLLSFLVLIFNFSFAQDFSLAPNGGEFVFNSERAPCLTETQRAEIHLNINENIRLLKEQGKHLPINKQGGHPLFIWPIAQATGFDFESVWGISNYLDENPAYPNVITDYNCGTRSYDTTSGYNHQGIDVFTWPFGWKQMDDSQAEIIAAEGGQIVGKYDGNYDRNCSLNGTSWNAVYVQHSDGSIAWYGHMKNGSLTSKGVGDSVSQGEYLGVVGSSGNSTGPHLHFEVYDSTSNLIDTYYGPCNTFNPDSWWLIQKPYNNTYVNAALTHSAPPLFPPCPTTEVTNTSDQFYAGDPIFLAVYLKDQVAGTQMTLRVRRPDNTIFSTWTFDLNDNYVASYWYWSNTVPSGSDGAWSWEVDYNGQSVVHPFHVGILGAEDVNLTETYVYPNPLQTKLFIESEATIVSVNIYDVLGRSVFEINDSTKSINEMNVSFLPKGMYFITLTSDENQTKTIKLIKE